MKRKVIFVKSYLFLIVTFFVQFSANSQEQNTPQFLQNIGTVETVYSEVLKESREFYIQIPNSYDPESKVKYPVIYVIDGEVFLPTVKNVHDYYSGGFMPEMVIVGISNTHNRLRDLTTSTITTMYGRPFNDKNGEAENFMKFLKDELIPLVEAKFPVTTHKTLIGHSYGGLFTINALLNFPDVFNNYIAIDPSLDWDNQNMITQAKTKLASKAFIGKSLFVSLSGQLHMQNPEITIENVMNDESDFTLFARSNIEFSDLVRKNPTNDLVFDWKFYPRDLHGTIPFPSIMDGLISVFCWYQWENTDKFNSPETPNAELSEFVYYRAKKLKDHFGYSVAPYPEDIFNMMGYMNMDMEQPEKAKMFFEFGIEFYPQSANSYDSFADYYEGNSDFANALKYATKAYELDQGDYYKNRVQDLKSKN